MKKTRIMVIAAIAFGAFAVSFDVLDDNGKAGRTGSPGESNCTGCHTGSALNDGTGSVTISSPDLPTWEYMPGDTYAINVTVARTGNPLFGFDLECLTGSTPAQNGGTLLVTNPAETHILTATVSTVARKNMTHQLNAGLSNDSKTFSFKWIAPTTNVGPVTFYCCGNAANNNGAKTGDHIYRTTQVVNPAVGAGTGEIANTATDFIVFPNPANENISVTYTTAAGEHVNFYLVTLEGKTVGPVYTFEGTGSATTSTLVLPENIASGVYLLRMENGATTSMKKVIVE